MSKIEFRELLRDTSKRVQAIASLAGHYRHPGGVGDAREYALVEALRELLPDRYAVDKGRVFDSFGNMSEEFDIIIYERDEALTAMMAAGKRVVPVEAVYAVLEVKSKLNKQAYKDSIEGFNSVGPLQRYYRVAAPRLFAKGQQTVAADEPVGAFEDRPYVPVVICGIVAYDAVGSKTIAKHLIEMPPPESMLWICVPGRELVVRKVDPPDYIGLLIEDDSLGLMLWWLVELLVMSKRSVHYRPEYRKYREALIESLDDIVDWSANAMGGEA